MMTVISVAIVLVLVLLLYGVAYKAGLNQGYKQAHIDIVGTLRKELY